MRQEEGKVIALDASWERIFSEFKLFFQITPQEIIEYMLYSPDECHQKNSKWMTKKWWIKTG